jgi:hypothetical protein
MKTCFERPWEPVIVSVTLLSILSFEGARADDFEHILHRDRHVGGISAG